MSNIILMENRQLIPRWHTSRKAESFQFPEEKTNVATRNILPSQLYWIEKAKLRWSFEKNILTATELQAILYMCGDYVSPEYNESLNYLLKHGSDLLPGIKAAIDPQIKHVDRNHLYTTDKLVIQEVIARLRKIVRSHPNDCYTWTDLAFYYTTLGLYDKAEDCLKVARHTCNGNSFVTRSYARFLIHQERADEAIWLLKKSGLVKKNPLISSAAIAIAHSFDLPGVRIGDGKKLLESYKGPAVYLSDLAACIGTLEYASGNINKAKKLFKQALSSPSENAISQFEWLSRKQNFKVPGVNQQIGRTLEGDVFKHYIEGNFLACRDTLIQLHSFQPISDTALSNAGYMSLVGLHEPNFVLSLSDGRIPKTHMGFSELNNLTVAKMLMNNTLTAELDLRLLSKRVNKDDAVSNATFLATAGMYSFKMGDIEGGKSLYQKAIEIFGKHKQERSKALAEHFYSHLIRNVDVEIYNALRKSIELAAKKHSLKELLKPLPDNF